MDVNEMINARLVHEIHTSERKSFRGCRRRWNWIFRENRYPVLTAKPLEFGVAYHEAMEKYYDPQFWDADREVMANFAIQTFIKKCEEQRATFLSQTNVQYLEEEVQADYDERVELGRGMLKYYFEQVAPVLDKGWKPVKVEIEFFVPIANPETGDPYIMCTCKLCFDKWCAYMGNESSEKAWRTAKDYSWPGLPVVLAGRLDMLAEDENGNYWIFDWKTAARITENYEFLFLDDQVGSYPWALWKLGLNVRGFIYHEQKKAFPHRPEKNKVRRLGRIFSVNKNQDVSYDSYLQAITEEDAEAYAAGAYDDFLTFLKEEGPQFYFRHQIHKSPAELVEIERNLGYEALDMIDPTLRVYPSPGRFSCNTCAFLEPCREQNAQGDYQYLLNTLFEQREHYYLRKEASTESKGAE